MFSFLNATALFAAAAALIPLIIHLFSRRRVKVVEFSSLRHLKAMQKRQVRRLKVRQILLLILRMLIILAVVIAFARPTSQSGQVGAHASVSAVILFDNSASMSRYVADGKLFDIAKNRAEELLKTFGQGDQVMVIPLERQEDAMAPSFTSAASAQDMLTTIEQGYGEADLKTALEVAADQLETAANLNREVYIVTDRQRHSLPETEVLDESEAKVFLVDLPLEEVENVGLTGVDFGGQLIQPGLDFNLTANFKNYGDEDRDDIIASLFVDGKRIAQAEAQVGSGSDGTVKFTGSVSRTGFHSGYVELSDDKYLLDNRYYFSFHIPERFTLLIISGDPAAQFIELALMPSTELTQSWSIKQIVPGQLSGVDFDEYDVVVLAGAPQLEGTYTERLKNYVQQGKSLMVTYGGGTSIEYFNSTWSDVTGVRFTEPIRQNFSRAGYYTIKSIDMQHPIFSVFGLEDNKPPEIKFYTLPKAEANRGTRSLIVFSGDRPALVETKYGQGKVLTFAGPMSPEYTDLPGHAFFVPMMSRIAEYLAANLSSLDTRLFTGGAITRALPTGEALTFSLNLITPDSMEYNLPPEESQGSLVVHARPVEQPGIYELRYLGREVDRFAANVKPEENDLSFADPDQFAAAIGAKDMKELPIDQPLNTVIAGFRFGRELWHIFVWIAIVLMAAEMLLARGAEPEE